MTAQDLESVETRTRTVLNDEDVATIMYPAYYDYARILHRLVTNFQGGGGLMREVQIQVDVWTTRDLQRPSLSASPSKPSDSSCPEVEGALEVSCSALPVDFATVADGVDYQRLFRRE